MFLLWVLVLTFMLITKVTSQVQQPTEIWWPNPFFRLLLDFLRERESLDIFVDIFWPRCRLLSLCTEGVHRLYTTYLYSEYVLFVQGINIGISLWDASIITVCRTVYCFFAPSLCLLWYVEYAIQLMLYLDFLSRVMNDGCNARTPLQQILWN